MTVTMMMMMMMIVTPVTETHHHQKREYSKSRGDLLILKERLRHLQRIHLIPQMKR